jgi:alanine racemase
MGALSHEELPTALAAGADVVVWSDRFLEQLAGAARTPVGVHVKLDTGMGRLGTRELSTALELVRRVAAGGDRLRLAGAMTHFATADEDPEFLEAQRRAFEPFAEAVRRERPDILVHAANSAATLRGASYHFDLVRCGIAIYGCDPANRDPDAYNLEPALALTSYVAAVKPAAPGDSVGYGRRFVASASTQIATIPIGYADGVRRALTNNCNVLIGGRRYPLVGTVSMDNIAVDLGEQTDVEVGDPATIVGRDGEERQTAEDVARRIDTINYEIVCGISARVPRRYHRDGVPVEAGRPA